MRVFLIYLFGFFFLIIILIYLFIFFYKRHIFFVAAFSHLFMSICSIAVELIRLTLTWSCEHSQL